MIELTTRTTLMRSGDFGASFELNETQHAYDVKFAIDVAELALAEGKELQIVDFGSGNGDKVSGLLLKMLGGGKLKASYFGVDIDEKNVAATANRVGQLEGIECANFFQLDLRDLRSLQDLILDKLDPSRLSVYFFDNSLHFLEPNSINDLLKICCQFAPPATQLLATTCSVWNKTSIGDVNNKNQQQRIKDTLLAIEQNPLEILWRKPGEIEHSVAMSHFTKESMVKVFSRAGFTVQDCVWWNNIIYPNGIVGLKENIKLRAVKL